jgi:hypothetical protein
MTIWPCVAHAATKATIPVETEDLDFIKARVALPAVHPVVKAADDDARGVCIQNVLTIFSR